MAYEVKEKEHGGFREVVWCRWSEKIDTIQFPSLAEIIEAAIREFPEIPFSDLMIEANGFEAELVCLRQKGVPSY